MLADAFRKFDEARQARDAARTEQRAERDQFIAAQFPALDLALVALLESATGTHLKLQLSKNAVVDTFTGRGFPSLAKTVTTVTSTLYGDPESIVFTPSLESIDPGQFGVVRVDAQMPGAERARLNARQRSLWRRGILMRGDAAAHLVVADGTNYVPLDAALLESFLGTLLIRGY